MTPRVPDVFFAGPTPMCRVPKNIFRFASRGAIRSSSIQETVRGGVGLLGRRLTKEMPCQGEAAHITRSSTHHDPARTMGRVRGQTLRSPDRIGRSGARRAGVELIAGGGERAPSTGLPAGRCRLLQRGARQPRRLGLSALQLMLMCVSMAILLHSFISSSAMCSENVLAHCRL